MSDHLDFELSGDRRLRLTSEGDLLVPPGTHPCLLDALLRPLVLATRGGQAEAGYRYAEVEVHAPGSLPALRAVLAQKLPELGLEGRTEPPLPEEEEALRAGDAEQDVRFDA